MISLSSTDEMLERMSHARSITFAAFGLWPGAVEQALEQAAQRGARVTVRLNAKFPHATFGMPGDNEQDVKRLRALGADAQLVSMADPRTVFHLKAAVCDGVAYLDDSNWRKGGDTIVRDDNPADVRAIGDAAACTAAKPCRSVQLEKGAALRAETRMLRARGVHRMDIESEGIGVAGVYLAAMDALKRGAHVRVLIYSKDGKEEKHLHAAALLQKAGAEVRETDATEKFSVTNGRHAWIGSANATWSYSDGPQPDWGVCTDRGSIVHALESRFDARWRRAEPLAPKAPSA